MKRLLEITAYNPKADKRLTMQFYSLKQAQYHNPDMEDFVLVRSYSEKETKKLLEPLPKFED